MPKIFDCFTYFNEEDTLEIRLEELYPVVDRFVIVYSSMTFRGNSHDYTWNSERFAKYDDKIYVGWTKDLIGDSAWDREVWQRNLIQYPLIHAKPEDTIIISDVDEIPRRSVVKPVDEEHRLLLDKYTYGLNMLTDEGNSVVRMLPYGHFNSRTIEEIRRGDAGKLISDAGWEFSSLGTPEEILVKLKSFSHSEFDTPDLTVDVIKERMSRRQDIVGRDFYHRIVEIDDTWPEAVKNDRQYWSKYEWTP